MGSEHGSHPFSELDRMTELVKSQLQRSDSGSDVEYIAIPEM